MNYFTVLLAGSSRVAKIARSKRWLSKIVRSRRRDFYAIQSPVIFYAKQKTLERKMGFTRNRPDGGVNKKMGITRPHPDGGLKTRKAPEALHPAVVLPPLRVQDILWSLKIRAQVV